MFIFIDTTNDELVVALGKNKINFSHQIIKGVKQKAELLPTIVEELLNKENLVLKDIQELYLNLGPGTFTGSRIALTFLRTIAQITKANLFTTTTFQIQALDSQENVQYFLDAKSASSYTAYVQNGKLTSAISLCPFQDSQPIQYEKLLSNFDYFSKIIFKKENNILEVEPLYIKEPQIGTRKEK